MNDNQNNNLEKKCGESCDCKTEQETKKDDQTLSVAAPATKKENQKEEDKLNPTRFGDWEIKGRAIDF
jgi:hypothetical protein